MAARPETYGKVRSVRFPAGDLAIVELLREHYRGEGAGAHVRSWSGALAYIVREHAAALGLDVSVAADQAESEAVLAAAEREREEAKRRFLASIPPALRREIYGDE